MTALAGLLMLAGALLTLIAAIGVFRFPDVLTRLHAATKAASVGIALVLVGAGAALGPGPLGFTLLVALFQVLTAPVAAHALGRAASSEPERVPTLRPASMPSAARIVGLAAVWVVLWGEPTPANLLGGLVVGGAVVSVTTRRDAERLRLRPVSALRFAGTFALLMVRSTISVAASALGPARRVDPVVHRIPLGPGSVSALVATANAVSLTPGTLTLAIDTEPPALVVHVIGPDESAVAAVASLHYLAAQTLPAAVSTQGGHE
jgi:multicomponent Na+:H+ antiporter subunit G